MKAMPIHCIRCESKWANEASWVLFRSFARTRHADCSQTTLFRKEDFGGHDHEEEQLLRIGPVHA